MSSKNIKNTKKKNKKNMNNKNQKMMDPNLNRQKQKMNKQQKQKKSRNSHNYNDPTNKNGIKNNHVTISYNPVSTTQVIAKISKKNGSPKGLHFNSPLKYPRKNKKSSNHDITSNGNGNGNANNIHNKYKSTKPVFQFKIGMHVGVALGDCYLQLQKLEHSMNKLHNISEDITDVMTCIQQMGGVDVITKNKNKNNKNKNDPDDLDDDPIEEINVLNDNLVKWQRDASKRMKTINLSVSKLQHVLLDLDDQNQLANNQWFTLLSQQQNQQNIQNQTDIQKAYETIKQLQKEIQQTKIELNAKTKVMAKLKKSKSEPNADELIRQKLLNLEQKEKELDRDAEIIATQSEELRKESERLLTERDEVKKQKESWAKMIEDIKEQKLKLEKRENELQANHKKLLELHETLSDEKKKLHKKAKKIKAREKRFNALRDHNSYNIQNNIQKQQQQPQQNAMNSPPQSMIGIMNSTAAYQVPSSNGSDYAASELTYFSDGDTELASVNSISDGSDDDNNNNVINNMNNMNNMNANDNYHKKQLNKIAHLGVPNNPMF